MAKGGERDARQVIANGGIFALAALGSVLWPSTIWNLAGAGAIAASTADTWATEIGTLRNASPVSILTGRLVPAGTSGGVTLAGFIAGFAGAAFIGLLALVLAWPPHSAAAALVGGSAGGVIDSLLGAAVQSRRWCSRCDRGTERAVHSCGTETVPVGGISWIGNDQVNLISSIGGALLGLAWA